MHKRIIIFSSLLVLSCLIISCSKKIDNKKESISAVNVDPKTIDYYVNEELLKGIKIDKLYEINDVIKSFGKYSKETYEPANIDYEGMKGNKIKVLSYEEYDLVIYIVEDNRQIFGYLRLHKDIKNNYINFGDKIDDIISRYGDKVNKWSDNLYTISATGINDVNFFSSITLKVNNSIVEQIEINLGEI